MRKISWPVVLLVAGVVCTAGCASAPDVRYAVEAEKVTTQALEPVMLESAELERDIAGLPDRIPAEAADDLMNAIRTEIAKTGRFTKVLLNVSEGDTYIIQPRIEKLDGSLKPVPNDPTRKKFSVRGRIRLDVLFVNQKNQKELVKSFYDERVFEERLSAKVRLTEDAKREYFFKTVSVAFRAAADQLGNGFNPSYEMGTISRIAGRNAYVQINTSRLRKLPKKQQAVEVIDDDNKVLATIAELVIEDGSLSGKMYEKGGAAISVGSKVRARVYALND